MKVFKVLEINGNKVTLKCALKSGLDVIVPLHRVQFVTTNKKFVRIKR